VACVPPDADPGATNVVPGLPVLTELEPDVPDPEVPEPELVADAEERARPVVALP
jgi:hypothetical protein